VYKAAVLVLVFIGIAARSAVAQGLQVPNDDFDEATVVSALPFDDTLDTRAASGATDDPICGGQCATVWYRYTPDANRAIGATTWGSDYDTRIFVFTGERGALELVLELWDPSYRLAVDAGTTYHFMVMSRTMDLSGGLLRFSLTDRPPLTLAVVLQPVATIDKQSGVITWRGELTCSLPAQVILIFLLERSLAQRNLHAAGFLELACAARAPFEVDIQTYSASRFGDYYPPGPYSALVGANGFDTSRHEPAEASLVDFPLLVRGAP
jgi:hypothetical protein